MTQSDKSRSRSRRKTPRPAPKSAQPAAGTGVSSASGSGPAEQPSAEIRAAAVRAARPALLVAAGVLGLEAIAVVGYGILIAANTDNVARGVGYGVAGMLIVWGVALALVGRGVALARTWARGPAVALQLFQFPLAWGFRENIGWVSVALFVTAAIVLICVFLPASTAAFTAGRKLPGQGD